MSTSIRICSYLLLPLIYLLVNVKIAQLGETFPITIVTFLPVLLLLFLERISVKKLMIALGIGAGLTAFNYLFGQSLDASKDRHFNHAVCLYCNSTWHGVEYSL